MSSVGGEQTRDVPKTIGGLLDWRLAATPDGAFARCDGVAVTYRALDRLVVRIEAGLVAEGLGRDDRVAVVGANSIRHLAVLFACARQGITWAPVNISLGSDDMAYTLGDLAPALVLAEREHLDAVVTATAARCVVLDPDLDREPDGDPGPSGRREVDGADPVAWDDWLPDPPLDVVTVRPDVRAGDPFCVMYSGGTTGRPKGVVLPHYAAVSCGERLGAVAAWGADEVFYSASHLFHAFLPCAIVPFCMEHGFEVVFDRWFSASNYWRRVNEAGATIVDPFIGMVGALLAQPESELDRTHGARLAISGFGGADPNSIALRTRFEARFGLATYQPYGQTEAGGFITVETESDERRFGSSGRLQSDWFDAVIVDGDELEVAPGSEGQLLVRPRVPHVMAHGYLNRADETLLNWRNLWVHTGDRCFFDTDGYLWFVGRGGHFLRRRGELVSIGEVELVIGGHPDIAEVAVVAVPSAMGEDDARASVVLRTGSDLTPDDLAAWTLERLAAFKVPRYIEFVDDIPRTATKAEVDRGALAARGVLGCYDREARR